MRSTRESAGFRLVKFATLAGSTAGTCRPLISTGAWVSLRCVWCCNAA